MGVMTVPTPTPERLQLRVATASGTVTVAADERSDVVVDDGGTVVPLGEGVVEVTPEPSATVDVRCPTGTDLVAGTVSGGVKLRGRLGSVSVTSSSGSIRVGAVTEADLRTRFGRVARVLPRLPGRHHERHGDRRRGRPGRPLDRVGVDRRGAGQRRDLARTVSGDVSLGTEAHGPVKARSVSGGIAVRVPAGVRPAVKVSGRAVGGGFEPGDDVPIEVTTTSGTVEISAS